jgi:2'-5' RNA ligase
LPVRVLDRLKGLVSDFGRRYAPLKGVVSGVGRFTGDDVDPVYLSFDCPELNGFREALVAHLEDAGVPVKKDHGFTPHITLAYVEPGAELPVQRSEKVELRFDKLDVWMGGEHFSYPLVGSLADNRTESRAEGARKRLRALRGV